MKISRFWKKDIVKKSIGLGANNPHAALLIDNNGRIMDTVYYSKENEIRSNSSVNTIISRQSSIITQAGLLGKEKGDKSDITTNNKSVKEFISWINHPNSEPSPSNRSDIYKYLVKEYYKSGVAALIFSFDRNNFSISGFRNIRTARSVNISSEFRGEVVYDVSIDSSQRALFKYSQQTACHTAFTNNEILVLFVLKNFDEVKNKFRSVFEEQMEYVLLQNYLARFTTAFHRNACFPSMIVQLTYKNLEPGQTLDSNQLAEFEEAVELLKAELKKNTSPDQVGKMIVPNHPSLEIKITPLNIQSKADENIAYDALATEKITSVVDGGFTSSLQGKSEFANNASSKIQEFYDGSMRLGNHITQALSEFMNRIFISMSVRGFTDRDTYYLALDIYTIRLYQKQTIQELTMLTQNNLVKMSEARSILTKMKDVYGFIDADDPDYDLMNAEIGGKQSQAPNVEGL